MIRVLFVCHGNICRSPMAEYLFKKMVNDKNLADRFIIDSKATSTEEIGNGVHYGTKRILDKYNIDYRMHKATQIKKSDYDNFDYIICMDDRNVYNCNRVFCNDPEGKIKLLLEYANIYRDISDPWYTGNFEKTEEDVLIGLNGFLDYLKENNAIYL
ncbi:MAG: low molecular weight phosphotyrosine protein phosphatase [Acholeplasmatales bacterium]|nr:low molecular weight phosphotyrosine protein phosphatase [Acholeplasmatales bacterium]